MADLWNSVVCSFLFAGVNFLLVINSLSSWHSFILVPKGCPVSPMYYLNQPLTGDVILDLTTMIIRRGIIACLKCLSDIRNTYPKVVKDSQKNFLGYQNTCRAIMLKRYIDEILYFGFLKSMYRISYSGYYFGYPKSFSDFCHTK